MPASTEQDPGYTVTRYFDLAESGYFGEDHVELLEGVVVASPPCGPLHASIITRVQFALQQAIGTRAVIRSQSPLIAGPRSVPEPDIAVLPGTFEDYDRNHPTSALLLVEVSDTSLASDRLTKSRIYASAGVPEYWIVNLRDRCVEVLRAPDPQRRVYTSTRTVRPGEAVEPIAFPGKEIAVSGFFPSY